MSDRIVKVPQGLTAEPYHQSALTAKGLSVIESCSHTDGKQGSMFLEDHLLLFVLQGTYTVRHGSQTYKVGKNEMVLLQKAIVVHYEKSGEPDRDYLLDYMMFFLKEDLLKDFMMMAQLPSVKPAGLVPVSVMPMNDRLLAYVESLKPYFNEPDSIRDNLIRIKLLELLFDLADANESFMRQFVQLKQQARTNISAVVEENLMNPVSLNDLAYLSGRSLSSFKRDFQTIYNAPPSQWIRHRRLDKARELLAHSAMSVTDVCFATGFESVGHFSRVFKERFGHPPSSLKQQLS
ncbi:AraC family transcriptional regulator [Paenibacillus beijingensis]|uniref:AraC family transcriptional regulator n=1 Tax=Paenibacillus beijingensis TaxID=1126833 RepID=A0A0D5NH02_9BACL|nr:AraC family transcriptional regulator [Paenibacillus beijingensis]AJY74232.1 AraC family transcriptional regulator [Paenibacillus beijingensis]